MRIAYISSSIFPSSAANGVHVLKMSEGLANNNHNVELLAARGKNFDSVEATFHNYNIKSNFILTLFRRPNIRVVGGLFYTLQALLYLWGKRKVIDLLYSRHMGAIWTARLLKLPYIFELHQIPVSGAKKNMLLKVVDSQFCQLLVVISGEMKAILVKEMPELDVNKIRVHHDAAAAMPEIDCEANKDNNTLSAGYIGSLYKGRGIEIILNLAKDYPEVTFYIIGGKNDQVDHWKQQCSLDNVVFTGFLSQLDLLTYFRDLDILLAPYQSKVSVSGGGGDTSRYMSPLKIFEYMSAGKAILCSNHRVLKEVLSDRVNAMLCDPGDYESWRLGLSVLVTNPALRKKIGEQAKKDFLEKYTWDMRARNIINELSTT